MNNIELHFEINNDLFEHFNEKLKSNKYHEITPLEHIKNALQLYGSLIDGLDNAKNPVFIDSKKQTAEKIQLPPLLAELKHNKEIENDKIIELRILGI